MDIDGDICIELLDSFTDLAYEIEISLDRLSQGTEQDLHALFRAIHNIKGNAAIVQLTSVVNFTHSLEEVIGSLRNEHYKPTPIVCEVIQLGMDRLKDIHQRDLFDQSFGNLQEPELIERYTDLAHARGEDVDVKCREILKRVGVDFVHESEAESDETDTEAEHRYECISMPAEHSKQAFDLLFFRELAQQIDRQSQYWEGRSEQSHDWAQKLNALRGSPVDPNQLSAATYLHDIGMSFISNDIIDKKQRLTIEELSQIRQHPVWGYNYLIRIEGWDQAATIILEHHERTDGKGYPIGNQGELIHDGAKILAIIDTFFSITNGRADRKKRKSTVRAVSEINARIGAQFDEEWVLAFNDMIKAELKAGNL
ncbi:MAG: Hpt domain-containing protein [Agarilytica sp.]